MGSKNGGTLIGDRVRWGLRVRAALWGPLRVKPVGIRWGLRVRAAIGGSGSPKPLQYLPPLLQLQYHGLVNKHISGISYGRKAIQSSTGTLYSRHLWRFVPLLIDFHGYSFQSH